MMKVWATVVSWQQGMALLHCDPQAACSSCATRSSCSMRTLQSTSEVAGHHLQLPSLQPLEPGQRVELGIAEGSLLRSAMLVYLTPLIGLLSGGIVSQWWLGSDLAAASGAILGGATAFWLARILARRLDEHAHYQPVVLQISLPPSAFGQQHIKAHNTGSQ